MSSLGFLLRDLSQVPTENDWLTPAEREWFNSKRSPKRVADWRLGRWTAKRAIETYLELQGQTRPSRIEILTAEDGAPRALHDGRSLPLMISLSHTEGQALCVVGGARTLLGCDLEQIEPRGPEFIESYFTTAEAAAVAAVEPDGRDLLANLIWSAKESALKALRTGLREDTRSVEVRVAPRHPVSQGSLKVACESHGTTFEGVWRQIGGLVMTIVSEPSPSDLIDLDLGGP